MLIAHTQKCIVIPKKKVGERVNLEADCMGKYAATAVGNVRQELKELSQQLRVTQVIAFVAVAAATAALAAMKRARTV
eukprot:symbB.v1.2.032888.t1/scaffold4012.1/size46427/2